MSHDHRIRFKRLNQVCEKALAQSISKLQNWDKLSSCYPGYISTREGYANLKTCQVQVCDFWSQLCRQEFQAIFEERDVKAKLDELDDLILKAKERARSQRDGTGNRTRVEDLTPAQLIQGSVRRAQTDTLEQLDARLRSLDDRNAELRAELEELNHAVGSELEELEHLYDKWLGKGLGNGAGELQQGVENMVVETREGP
ncbi:AaceriABR150Cp [[Ashbya] aceris (nom. inval.)]|nr:AaceriABR150Cp [[Ashbya] aceris (nom. inval.)]